MTFSSSGAFRTLCFAALCGACLAAILLCRTGAYQSDPRPNLYTAEALIDHGTVRLDSYGKVLAEEIAWNFNGHYYAYFPIGTALFSLPVVAVYRILGLHIVNHEADAQIAVISVVSLLTLVFLFRIARLFLGWRNALAATALFWFGTSLASTDATGLWSHDFAVLWALMGLHATLLAGTRDRRALWPWIGVCLFSAYLCRPTMAVFAGTLLLFLASYDLKRAFLAGFVAGLFMALFVAWSFHDYGTPLPPYYSGTRLGGGQFWLALYGNLLSPARGLLVYSPFLVLVWLCRDRNTGLRLKPSWLLLGLAWPLAHLIAISRFPLWWGGASYGPRLMTDVLPGLFLLTLQAWPKQPGDARKIAAAGLLAAGGLFAVYVNTWQGLFNPFIHQWMSNPLVDRYPECLFDWRYPQFLYDAAAHERRMAQERPLAAANAEHVEALRRDTEAGLLAADAPLDPALDIDVVTPVTYSPAADFVRALYRVALNRAASPAEIDHYVEFAGDHRAIPLFHYAMWFMAAGESEFHHHPDSPEGDTSFIAASFQDLLHRAPSDAEMAKYQTLFASDRRGEADTEARARVIVYLCIYSLWRGDAAPH